MAVVPRQLDERHSPEVLLVLLGVLVDDEQDVVASLAQPRRHLEYLALGPAATQGGYVEGDPHRLHLSAAVAVAMSRSAFI